MDPKKTETWRERAERLRLLALQYPYDDGEWNNWGAEDPDYENPDEEDEPDGNLL